MDAIVEAASPIAVIEFLPPATIEAAIPVSDLEPVIASSVIEAIIPIAELIIARPQTDIEGPFILVQGSPGKSAYELAVLAGFAGTEAEWLASLQGEPGVGIDGDDGLSAYQLAVQNGFTGTEAEWLASLKGDKGDDGVGLHEIFVDSIAAPDYPALNFQSITIDGQQVYLMQGSGP